jgi:hypothetical protein
MNQEGITEKRVYHLRRSEPGTKPFKSAAPVEHLVAQEAGVPVYVVGAVTGEEVLHHLGLANVRKLQGEVGHQDQVGIVDWTVGSSVVDVVLALGVGAALHQNGAVALDQGLVRKLEGGWLGSRDPWDLTQALGRPFRQL